MSRTSDAADGRAIVDQIAYFHINYPECPGISLEWSMVFFKLRRAGITMHHIHSPSPVPCFYVDFLKTLQESLATWDGATMPA